MGEPEISEMVEKVARAIAQGHGARMVYKPPGGEMMQTVASIAGFGHWGDSADKYAAKNWQNYVLAAQLAIATMRSPTDAMVDACSEITLHRARVVHSSNIPWSEGWRAMIDEALK